MTRPVPAMIVGVLDLHGIPYRIDDRGKHRKFRIVVNGQRAAITCPISPSDHRALKNQYAQLRGKLTSLGVSFHECKDLIQP